MPVDHTRTSRSATVATMLLVLVQLLHLVGGDHDQYVDVMLMALIVATAAAWVKLHRDNSLEARLAVGFLALLSGGGMFFAMSVGLPGQVVTAPSPFSVTTLLLSMVVLVLLGADRSGRAPRPPRQARAARRPKESPYAS